MSRWLVVLTLAAVSAIAQADSEQPSRPSAATDIAAAATGIAERDVAQLTARSAALEKRYTDELDAIDRLKRRRPSWRRDREIRDSLSSSLETSNQLDVATAALKKAKSKLDSVRRAYLAAIQVELVGGSPPARTQRLQRAKALLAWQLKDAGAPRHIMIPDLDVDPLADPEELDQRAAELRESELLLSRQLAVLVAQASELQRTAQLRKHNDRAVDLVTRYEDSPHRRTARGNEPVVDVAPEPPPTQLPTSPDSRPSRDNTTVPVRTNDVIETSADTLSGSRSANPAQRAEAARKAYDEMARRLQQVRSRRLEIEARARLLRSRR
jgi:hypothetical protein